jgi:peroxiredoxin
MAQFEPLIADIEEAGAELAFIAAEKRSGIWKPTNFLEKHPSSFPFLLDEDRAVTKAYGLYHRIGKDAIHIAHPATLIVDGGGNICYVYVGDNQTDRAPLEEVMAAIRNIHA